MDYKRDFPDGKYTENMSQMAFGIHLEDKEYIGRGVLKIKIIRPVSRKHLKSNYFGVVLYIIRRLAGGIILGCKRWMSYMDLNGCTFTYSLLITRLSPKPIGNRLKSTHPEIYKYINIKSYQDIVLKLYYM